MISRIEQTNWALVGTMLLGLLLAAFLGITIAGSDYNVLLYIIAFFGVVSYVAYFQRFTWQIALLLCYLGLVYRPLGFDFGPTELSGALAVSLAAATIWQKRSRQRVGILRHRSFTVMRWLLLAWTGYVLIHMAYNLADPFRPADFQLKNALKTYFTGIMPTAILLYFSGNPSGIRINKPVLRTIAKLLLLGVIFNLAVVSYGLIFKPSASGIETDSWYAGTLFVPGLNARENIYMLRTLGPAAVLFASITLTMGRNATGVSRGLSNFLLLVASLGCLLSGGRAAVTSAILLVLAVLLIRKRILSVMLILIAAGIFVFIVNFSASWINREAPLSIARPLQWMMLNKSKEAAGSIESSSMWRREVFDLSLTEWQSDRRIFWFGRATYGFGVSDFIALKVAGGWEAMKESALRRGATHSLLTDLLVTYGLIGAILYYCLILAVIRFLWIIYKSADVPAATKPVSLFCFITYASYLVIASIAGGLFLTETIWPVVVLIAVLYQYRPQNTQRDVVRSRNLLPSAIA